MKGSKIYKINHISVNETKSQFCLSHNNGIKLFDTRGFVEIYSIDNLENISLCILIRELKMAVFVGSKENEKYSNKTVVIYDLISNKEVFTTSFLEEIKDIKIINTFIILKFQLGIKIFLLENSNNLKAIKDISLENGVYEVWENSLLDESQIKTISLIYYQGEEIIITDYKGKDWQEVKKQKIPNKYKKIQGFFYIRELDWVFVVDEVAKYIYGLNPKDGKEQICLYRGSNPGIITSMSLLNKKYLLFNNINRTIYIIDLKPSGTSLSSLIGKIYSIEGSTFMTIKYNELMGENEERFFEKDFAQRGSILWGDSEGNQFNLISYNGFAYKIRINFLKAKMGIEEKIQIAKYNINFDEKQDKEENKDNSQETKYKSIFDTKQKTIDDEKFINL